MNVEPDERCDTIEHADRIHCVRPVRTEQGGVKRATSPAGPACRVMGFDS